MVNKEIVCTRPYLFLEARGDEMKIGREDRKKEKKRKSKREKESSGVMRDQ